MIRRSRSLTLALALTLALVATACGDDDGDDASPTTSAAPVTTSTEPGTTAPPPEDAVTLAELQIVLVEFGDAGYVEIENRGASDADLAGIVLTQGSTSADLGTVVGDRIRVVQILTNLVGNACSYTPAGGRIVIAAEWVQAGPQVGDPRPALVELTVADTGIGIPRADMEHVFERFYRGRDPMVQEQPGTGLGLSITRSLVELHGSHLWVDSTVGQGSTFGFSLPLGEVALDKGAPSSFEASVAGEGVRD